MEKIHQEIEVFPELSKPISVVNLVKYSNKLTTKEIQNIISFQPGTKLHSCIHQNFDGNPGMLNNFVDSTGQYARITTLMKDIGTDKMDKIQSRLQQVIAKEFPEKQYKVSLTGKALVFLKGTNYLISNLVFSLSLAIVLISLFMAWMFRSFRMILISIIPNMLY